MGSQRAAGLAPAPMPRPIALDGIDEYLDVFLGLTRALNRGPASPTMFTFACADGPERWSVDVSVAGERIVDQARSTDVTFSGPPDELLRWLWGRGGLSETTVEVIGDPLLAAGWAAVAPPM